MGGPLYGRQPCMSARLWGEQEGICARLWGKKSHAFEAKLKGVKTNLFLRF
jgi:hypothetical protein